MNLPAASPKSYFRGLPLPARANEPRIIQPQRVAAAERSVAAAGFSDSRCPEQKRRHLKSQIPGRTQAERENESM